MSRPRAALLVVVVALSACGSAEDPLATVHVESDPSLPFTICMNGAGGDRHPGNQVVDAMCAGLSGLVQDCAGETCRATFRFSELTRVVDVMRALRSDDEGRARPLHVVGYSFGAVNALDAIARLHADPALDEESARVDRVAVIDPFAPFASEPLDVADNVRAFWSYRHSIAPVDDCSADRPVIGPYEGLRPRCLDGTPCFDFDWSVDAETAHVDHCDVTDVSAPAIVHNLAEGENAHRYVPLPEGVPVERRPKSE